MRGLNPWEEPMIDSYEFGRIVVDGKIFSSDVIIYPERVKGDWWRKEGHELSTDDLDDVLDRKPDVIVVGTGNPGMMRVLPQTEKLIRSKRIELIVQPTKRACETYNQLSSTKRVIAMLHLTC
jgi:hypothetical protein